VETFNPHTPSSRQKALGGFVGAAGAIFIFSILVAFYSWPLFLGVILIPLSLVVGIRLGAFVATKVKVPELSKKALILRAILIISLCAYGPIGIKTGYLHYVASAEMPLAPGAVVLERHIKTFGVPEIEIITETSLPLDAVVSFYRAELKKRNWVESYGQLSGEVYTGGFGKHGKSFGIAVIKRENVCTVKIAYNQFNRRIDM
jgi:hypothetical protein